MMQATKPIQNLLHRSIKEQMFNQLKIDYGFPNAICRSLTDMFEKHLELYLGKNLGEGQILYRAVGMGVPPGTKHNEMNLVAVKLTLFSPEDIKYASISQHELLKQRIIRISNEAMDQGGLLTQADLSILLGKSLRTIERYIKELKNEDIIVPTRGNRMDIGPGVSHKSKIVEMYIKGYDFSQIKQYTRHSSESILRYLKEFSRVMILFEQNYKPYEIRMITDMSERIVKEYIDLYHQYKEMEEYQAKIEQIREMYRGKKIQLGDCRGHGKENYANA
jgi:hypothetical protein